MKRVHFIAFACAVLSASCSVLPEKPVRPTLYDFGPGVIAAGVTPSNFTQPPLLLAEVEVSSSFENTAFLYRLGYSDANQLRPYAFARWSAPPAQLVRQRLREHLGRDRLVLDNEEAAALVRSGASRPRVLRVEMEEFTHYFESATKSVGLLRLRCTLLDNTSGGERLVAQRTITTQAPAPSADAPGGVRALAAATDAAAQELTRWLQAQR